MYTIKTMFWLLCGFIYCSKIISPYFSSMYKMSCDDAPKMVQRTFCLPLEVLTQFSTPGFDSDCHTVLYSAELFCFTVYSTNAVASS